MIIHSREYLTLVTRSGADVSNDFVTSQVKSPQLNLAMVLYGVGKKNRLRGG